MGLARIRGLLGKQMVSALRSFPSKPSLQLSFLDVLGLCWVDFLYVLVSEQDVVPSKPKEIWKKNHHETMGKKSSPLKKIGKGDFFTNSTMMVNQHYELNSPFKG